MKAGLQPPDEAQRLAALRALKIVDTPVEERFERITRIARHLFDVPVALISLVDADRHWFKSRQGLSIAELPRENSFCGQAILDGATLVVPDALVDERFAANPLVTGPPYVRSYMGQPLATPDGYRVGTLCLLDHDPRHFTSEEQVLLKDLALIVENELNSRQALIESETRYRTLFDTAPVVIYTKDQAGTYTSANAQALTYWEESPVGHQDSDLLPPEFAAELQARDLAVMGTGRELILKEQFPAPYGLRTFLSLRAPLRDAAGNLTGLLVISLDMTAIQEAEQHLRQTEEKYRQVLESIEDGYYETDLNGNFTFFNQATPKILGYPSEELVGKNYRDFTDAANANKVFKVFNRVFHTGIPEKSLEWEIIRKDGQRRFVETSTSLIRDTEGRPIGFRGVGRDITEREQVEAELSTLLEVSRAVSSTLDLEEVLGLIAKQMVQATGTTACSLLRWDRAKDAVVTWIEWRRFDPDEADEPGTIYRLDDFPTTRIVLEEHRPIIIMADDPEADPAEVALMKEVDTSGMLLLPLTTGEQVIGLVELETKEVGRIFAEAEISFCQALADQAVIAIENARLYHQVQHYAAELEQRVARRTAQLERTNVDLQAEIAERRRAQEHLTVARDQAVEASRLKTELLAKVSHELRTPLGAVLGFAEMLEVGVFGPVSNQQKQALNDVILSTRYLTDLVNELLDQAQLEAGRLKLNIGPFAPTDIVDSVLTRMKMMAQAKGLTMSTEIAPDLPEILMGDAIRIQQILFNLVSNAIKFTGTGEIEVRLFRSDADRWAMQICDSGPGIPVEAQAYIFEPFRQVDGSITRENTGTGLGLSIVKQLTGLMGGQIRLESEVGRGTIFTVVLPLEPAQEKMG